MRLPLSPTRGLLLTGAALALVVSACGSDAKSTSITAEEAATTTTVAAQQPTGSAPQGGGRGAGMQEAITAFTAGLGEHGVTVPDVSFPSRGDGGQPPFNGSRPANAPDGSLPANRTPGSFPGRGNGGGNFDPVAMIVERLGLDTSDATVKAAVDACSPALTAAMPNRGGAQQTTTTG